MTQVSDNEYIKNLPAKRMAVGVIVTNDAGEILVVKPSYKDHWTLPGGVIDKNESPRAAAIREVREEIGLETRVMDLVTIDYMSPQDSGYSTKDENIQFIFYGGKLGSDDIAKIKIQEDEISEYRFVVKDEAGQMVSEKLANRLPACYEAIASGVPIYLEGGRKH